MLAAHGLEQMAYRPPEKDSTPNDSAPMPKRFPPMGHTLGTCPGSSAQFLRARRPHPLSQLQRIRVEAFRRREQLEICHLNLAEPYSHPSASSDRQPKGIQRRQAAGFQCDQEFSTLPSLRAHQLQPAHNRLNPPMKIAQIELLVRRMQIVVRQPEPHQHRRNPKLAHKVSHNRD